MLLISALIGLLVTKKCGAFPYNLDNEATWIYTDGSQSWPGECQDGRRQSPIDITRENTIEDIEEKVILGDLQFNGYHDVSLNIANKGITVDFDTSNSTALLRGGPLRAEYVLHSFHYHTPSEHTLDFIKYPLELHFVHRRKDLTLQEALSEPDGVAVIGKFVTITSREEDGKAINQLMPYLDQVAKIGEITTTGRLNVRTDLKIYATEICYGTAAAGLAININTIFKIKRRIIQVEDHEAYTKMVEEAEKQLLGDTNSFYTYQGSLTTPDCQEVVTWIVLEKPLAINDAQFTTFRKLALSTPVNFRNVQPTNNRKVYRSIGTSGAIATTPPPFAKILLSLGLSLITLITNVYTKSGSIVKQILYNDKKRKFTNL